ncbi:alpha/beta hydrolase [Salegentibacter sp. F188]|uniref:Alpha/beta hydrolase n=1 Tax=Autumnicola patrickiae TaxID=3075591 RepID=A0ABU3E1K5_9FLAO|nr:alpha/beta hydrolase [Salegentibacter sp. F188]MDT0689773.1 alpha/beta hydrolase [Salegentibacter sp. F188]
MSESTNSKIENVIHNHEQSGKYFEVDGQKTFALDYGKGEVVLCIHGVPTSSFLYRKVLRSLANKGYRGISIDLPGLGLSSRPENFEYTFSKFAEFLTKAIKALDIQKFHLVVHDIGGPIGFALAARQLENVLSLTILNTWVDVVNFKKPLPMRPFEKKILGEAQLKMMTRDTWPIMFSQLGVSNTDNIPSEEIKAYVDLLKREDNGKAFLKIMRQFPDSPEFRDICLQAVQGTPYPLQAIWGEEDPGLTYERYGKEIQKFADLKEMILLPSKHFLQEEIWEQIATKIDELAKTAY